MEVRPLVHLSVYLAQWKWEQDPRAVTGVLGARAALTPGTELGVSPNIPGFVGGTILGARVSLATCPCALTVIAESDIYAEIPDETLRRPGGRV